MVDRIISPLLEKLKVALDACANWQWNVYDQTLEIDWRLQQPDITNTDVRVFYVHWVEFALPVRWHRSDLERLLAWSRGERRALAVIVSHRSQTDVEILCAKLRQLDEKRSQALVDDTREFEVLAEGAEPQKCEHETVDGVCTKCGAIDAEFD